MKTCWCVFDFETRISQLETLQKKAEDPTLWDDPDEAKKVMDFYQEFTSVAPTLDYLQNYIFPMAKDINAQRYGLGSQSSSSSSDADLYDILAGMFGGGTMGKQFSDYVQSAGLFGNQGFSMSDLEAALSNIDWGDWNLY